MKELVFCIFLLSLISCGADLTPDDEKNSLHLIIPETSQKQLNDWKETALEQGMISDDLKEYVPAQCVLEGDTFDIELRLKGDWTDHLKSDLTSYRIKFPKEKSFMGARKFSIQDPATRNYANEWFMHRLLEQEGLLTTHYQFIPVYINGSLSGVYAFEEHFEKSLLDRQNRPDGPIFKMDESGLWAARHSGDIESFIPVYPAAVIGAYNEAEPDDSAGYRVFLQGLAKMGKYQSNLYDPSIIFDLDQTAKYLAILDIGDISHGLTWHNQRLYFNPEKNCLEFIGFDLDAGRETNQMSMALEEIGKDPTTAGFSLMKPLLYSDFFKERYLFYLKTYSDPIWLNSMEELLRDEIAEVVRLLGMNEWNYSFDLQFYRDNGTRLRKELETLEIQWDDFLERTNHEMQVFTRDYCTDKLYILPEVSINAYLSEKGAAHVLIIENYAVSDVLITGYASKKEERFMLNEPIRLKGYTTLQDSCSLPVSKIPEKLFFRYADQPEKEFSKAVIPWPLPSTLVY